MSKQNEFKPKKYIYQKIASIVVVTYTLMAFQNCSQYGKVQVSPGGSVSQNATSDNDVVVALTDPPPDTGSAPLQVIPPSTGGEPYQPPVVDTPVVNPPVAELPPADEAPVEQPIEQPIPPVADVPPVQDPVNPVDPVAPPDRCSQIKVTDISIQFQKVRFNCERKVKVNEKHGGFRWAKVKTVCEAQIGSREFSINNNKVIIKVDDDDAYLTDGEFFLVYSHIVHRGLSSQAQLLDVTAQAETGLRFKLPGHHRFRKGKFHSLVIDIDILKSSKECQIRPLVRHARCDDAQDDDANDDES